MRHSASREDGTEARTASTGEPVRPAWRPSAASGTRAAIASAVHRDGTLIAGMIPHISREGVGTRWPGDAHRARDGEGERDDEHRDEPGRAPPPFGASESAGERNSDPAHGERDREQPQVVVRLRRVRPVQAAVVKRSEPVSEHDVLRRRHDELERPKAVDREVARDAMEARSTTDPGDDGEDADARVAPSAAPTEPPARSAPFRHGMVKPATIANAPAVTNAMEPM